MARRPKTFPFENDVPAMGFFFNRFTDAHAHLPENPENDGRISVPADAKILLNSARPEDFPRIATIAKKFPDTIVPAFGVHPWFAESFSSKTETALRRCISETRGACVGEIGLDKCRGDFALQQKVFETQLALAAEFGVPASIHCVRAFGVLERILRRFSDAGTLPIFLLHAYGGSAEQAKNFAALGGTFSNPKKSLPSECIVVFESDAPLDADSRSE